MRARCMLDRAERLASGHADPQPCVAYRSEWSARNQSLRPAELAEDLPRPHPQRRWSALAGPQQFAKLLEEDGPRLKSAIFVTTGSHDTFEEMVWNHNIFVPVVLSIRRYSWPAPRSLSPPPTEGMASGSLPLL